MTASSLTPAQARPTAVADGVEKYLRGTKYGEPVVAPLLQLWFPSNAATPAQFELELGHWER